MRSKQVGQRIVVFLSVAGLLLLAFGFIAWMERPSLRRIASNIASLQTPQLVAPRAASPQRTNDAGRGFNFRALVNSIIGPRAEDRPPHLTHAATDAIIERFVERGDIDIRVCDSLGDIRPAPPRGAKDLHAWASERIEGRLENAFLEAMLIPIGFVMSRPTMAPIALQVRDTAAGTTPAGDFAALQAQAQAELYSSRLHIQDVSIRSYHLYVLFQAVNWRPELAHTASTSELCESIETRLEASVEGVDPEVSLEFETQEVMNWLAASRVSPQDAGFNPALSGAVSVLVTEESLGIEPNWMRSALGAGLVMGLPPVVDRSVQAGR